jgi:rsbT co-antagonist protein RsbR
MTAADDPEGDSARRIADILGVLSGVTAGAYSSRLPELPEHDTFSVLYRAINDMVEALADSQARGERFQKELTDKLTTIEEQRAAIRELSTPVIEVWEGVLCLPVVGVMDTTRSAEMTETLLRAVVERRVACTIIDVTGIEVMDTGTADHFLRMARAVRLLGAQCVITGISPRIAETIVHMGVDLTDVRTHRSLRDALTNYIRQSLVNRGRARSGALSLAKGPPRS